MGATIGIAAGQCSINSLEVDRRIPNGEAAENFSYGWFQYGQSKLTYTLAQPFFKYSYRGFHEPDRALLRRTKESDVGFMTDCASNYVLKNFWHNHVHNQLPHIKHKHENYRDFGGESRYMSDFEADNMANILLAVSYGHHVSTTSPGR